MGGRAYRWPPASPEPVLRAFQGWRPPGEGAGVTEAAQLSSISSALTELTDRLTAIAETLTGTEREDVAVALFEVERSLLTGSRRLDEVLRSLG